MNIYPKIWRGRVRIENGIIIGDTLPDSTLSLSWSFESGRFFRAHGDFSGPVFANATPTGDGIVASADKTGQDTIEFYLKRANDQNDYVDPNGDFVEIRAYPPPA